MVDKILEKCEIKDKDQVKQVKDLIEELSVI